MTLGPAGVPYEAACSSTLNAADSVAAIQIPPKSGCPSGRCGGVNADWAEAHTAAMTSIAGRIMLLSTIARGGRADLTSVREFHGTGIGRVRSILGSESVDDDVVAGPQRFLPPSAAKQRIGAAGFD